MPTTSFKGGVHPPYLKEATREEEIRRTSLPKIVRIPLQQHIGAPANPVVELGEHVKTGQLIAEPGGYISASVHSSVSGKITAIRLFPHPLGTKMAAIEIESDGRDTLLDDMRPVSDYLSMTSEEIVEAVQRAGIVGMGGATFPTHVKLKPPTGRRIHTLILNGAECEPFLTCDFRLMLERPDEILQGALLMKKAVSAERIIIGIEGNKEEAIQTMSKAAASFAEVSVERLEVKYPQGSELQLIEVLAGVELPKSKLPLEAGFVVQNVATSLAVFEAVTKGKPLYERVVTVAGSGIKEPCNLLVRIGTLFKDVVEQAGGVAEDAGKVIMGGPMMGLAEHSLEVPVVKGTSGILVLRRSETPVFAPLSCIRCGRCETYCPSGLPTARIGLAVEFGKFDVARALGVMECIECGCCSYVCPSKRPMTHNMRAGKAEVMQMRERDKVAGAK